MLQFVPTIVQGDVMTELPRPITVCRIHDSWDFLKMKVPRRDGDQLAGISRDGVEITLEGQIGSHSGEITLGEQTMLATIETLRRALHPLDDIGFALALFQEGTHQYRYFRNCLTSRFDFDLSNQHLYSYAISIHASDPVLYEGLPG